jgi:hypothetical protein
MTTWIKDPSAAVPYTIDWGTKWLIGSDTIASSTWTVPSGITKVSDTHDTKTCTIKLSGGTAGQEYVIANKIVTVGGITDERSFTIRVEDR